MTKLPAGKYYIGDHTLVTGERSDHSFDHSFPSAIPRGNFLAEMSLKPTEDLPGKIRVVNGRISIIPYKLLDVYEEDANEYGVVISSKNPILVTVVDGHFIIRSQQLFIYINTNMVNDKDDYVYNKAEHDSWMYENSDHSEEEDDEDEDEDDEDDEEEEEDEEDEEEEDEEEEEEEEEE
jgi:hypothetical protein